MFAKKFHYGVVIRVIGLVITMFIGIFSFAYYRPHLNAAGLGVLTVLIISQIYNLIQFVEQTNRRLVHFFASIQFSDFSGSFAPGNQLGSSFEELHQAFNKVLDVFRKTRAEREAYLQYLNTVVEQVNAGVISFDSEGVVSLINTKARYWLGLKIIQHIDDLKESHPGFYAILNLIQPGEKKYILLPNNIHLVIRSAEIQLQGKVFQLLALQDIQSELQQKELDAWQNLTSVLRHEIMNTVTPIAALSNALMEIVREDAAGKNGFYSLPAESYEDLSEGLAVIQKRTQGLVRFVDAYRSYTKLPKPVFAKVSVLSLFEKTHSLLSPLLARQGVEWKQNIFPKNIELIADEGLLEIVLINLVRNAIDALRNAKDPQIILTAKLDHYGRMLIQVADNGSGVEEELKTKVFIPFFTSKESGSGIGLSLCRQILQLHNGVITLENAQNPTVFSIRI